MNLHPSHKLWTAGGLAFCSVCGAVSQGTFSLDKSRLSLTCGSKPGRITTRPRLIGQHSRLCKMPAGSIWKVQQLLSGRLRGVGKSVWPDGTPGGTVLVPSRLFPYPVEFSTGNHPIEIGGAVDPC